MSSAAVVLASEVTAAGAATARTARQRREDIMLRLAASPERARERSRRWPTVWRGVGLVYADMMPAGAWRRPACWRVVR